MFGSAGQYLRAGDREYGPTMTIELHPIHGKAERQDFMKAVAWQYEDDLMNAFELSQEAAARKTQRDMRGFLEGSLDEDSNHLFHMRKRPGGEHVGAIWLVTENDVGIAWLCYVLVYGQYRRNGYGTQAIRLLHEKARELGCDQINLYVHCHNAGAHTLYQKLGYQASSHFMRLAL